MPFVRGGRPVRAETIAEMRARARAELIALPPPLRRLDGRAHAYPVAYSDLCQAAARAADEAGDRSRATT